MISTELNNLTFKAKRNFFLGSRIYDVQVYHDFATFTHKSESIKLKLSLENVLYWELEKNEEKGFGFKHA